MSTLARCRVTAAVSRRAAAVCAHPTAPSRGGEKAGGAVSTTTHSRPTPSLPEHASRRLWYLATGAFLRCLRSGAHRRAAAGGEAVLCRRRRLLGARVRLYLYGPLLTIELREPAAGYFLPLINYVLKSFTGGALDEASTAVTLFIALIFALTGAIFAPRLAEITWPRQSWGFWRRIALMALLLIFWCGNLDYPLTDFPGLAFGLLALVAVAQSDSPGWMLIAGMAAGATLDLRPAYLPLVGMLFVIVSLNWSDQRRTQHVSAFRRRSA